MSNFRFEKQYTKINSHNSNYTYIGPYYVYDYLSFESSIKRLTFMSQVCKMYLKGSEEREKLNEFIEIGISPKINSRSKRWFKFSSSYRRGIIVQKKVSAIGNLSSYEFLNMLDNNSSEVKTIQSISSKGKAGEYFREVWIPKFLSGEIQIIGDVNTVARTYISIYVSKKFGWL